MSRGILAIALAAAGLVACGGRSERPVRLEPNQAADTTLWWGPGRCPPPLSWPADARRPRGIRVHNRTEERVLVFMDWCQGHVRLGTVLPGRTRLYRLPEPLVRTRGGLTFHTFFPDRVEYNGAATLPVDTTVVLELEVGARLSPRVRPQYVAEEEDPVPPVLQAQE